MISMTCLDIIRVQEVLGLLTDAKALGVVLGQASERHHTST